LFKAEGSGRLKADKILLQVKIIATDHLDTTNDIVRANNNQNIVLAEAFETTRPFHIKLEEFFKAKNAEGWEVHYERRAKQYQHDPRIKDKVNLSVLTKFFVGMFLNQPHMSVRHESKLLKEFEGRIYEDGQSLLPYFTTAAAFCLLETFFRCGECDRLLYSFRAHLLMLFRQLIGGNVPSINLENAIDKHSNQVLAVLKDKQKALEAFGKCAESFVGSRNYWIESLKKSPSGMKDVPEFTQLLLSRVQDDTDTPASSGELDDKLRGRVCNVIIDRHGKYAGFIRRYSTENLFFHEQQNPALEYSTLRGAFVSYRVKRRDDGSEYGVEVFRESEG
ncbi:AIPR family protein, partial [Candidatus Sumerlaeota bacterium]|nr:AIPR family protein [Candidatus Sumerlaeota bacterium]